MLLVVRAPRPVPRWLAMRKPSGVVLEYRNASRSTYIRSTCMASTARPSGRGRCSTGIVLVLTFRVVPFKYAISGPQILAARYTSVMVMGQFSILLTIFTRCCRDGKCNFLDRSLAFLASPTSRLLNNASFSATVVTHMMPNRPREYLRKSHVYRPRPVPLRMRVNT